MHLRADGDGLIQNHQKPLFPESPSRFYGLPPALAVPRRVGVLFLKKKFELCLPKAWTRHGGRTLLIS